MHVIINPATLRAGLISATRMAHLRLKPPRDPLKQTDSCIDAGFSGGLILHAGQQADQFHLGGWPILLYPLVLAGFRLHPTLFTIVKVQLQLG